MAKRVLYLVVGTIAVIIGFPYIKQFFDIFLASGGIFERLPNMSAWEIFFWTAFPYAILFGVPLLLIVMIFLKKRGGA